jgi:N-hydroxyarylamine O-acetyltransferase
MEPRGFDLDRYLARIGLARPSAPTREALEDLHEAHLATIPFENLDILLGRPIGIDLASVQAKLVDGRRGGYCFEQNTLFQAALDALGFTVTALGARVQVGTVPVRPRTHMLLRVELKEGPFLADVGFGGEGPVRPLPLVARAERWVGEDGHRLRAEPGLFVLQGRAASPAPAWTDFYCFSLEPHSPVDFEMANHYTSTWPHSRFVNNLTAQQCWPGRRVMLRNRELTRFTGAAAATELIRDPDHLLEVLHREFGLSFPPGTRFSRPRFD